MGHGVVPRHRCGARASGRHPELVVDLGFTGAGPGFQAEGTVYAPDGVVLGGIEPRRRAVPLAGGAVDLYVEAAANPDMTGGWGWAPTPLGDLATAGDDPLYHLGAVELADLDRTVWGLLQDIWTLSGLVEALPGDLPRRAEVLRALERAVDAVDPDDVAATAAAGRAELADVLARPAHASAHRVYAVGHAHIDSAWLWPVRETVRKVTRTFANALQLMETDDELVFAASSAQQYAWMRDHQPELFARIRKRAAEGRFVPVGGMWVESDTNMPGGEALARQLVYGGGLLPRASWASSSDGVWLPDSFGYSAALPQIAAAAGRRWLLTQKISWNDTNRFPHHTFDWEGIDGTRILHALPARRHLQRRAVRRRAGPRAAAVRREGPGQHVAGAVRLGRRRRRAHPGDAGRRAPHPRPGGLADRAPGPSVGVLRRRGRRVPGPAGVGGRAVPGVPPRHLHHAVAHEARQPAQRAPAARGRAVGRPPRPSARARDYPYETLRRCWETVLLQQFHDILPGTSIAWVHRRGRAGVRPGRRRAGRRDRGRADACSSGPATASSPPTRARYAVDGVPGLGVATVADPALENDEVRVVVDERGLITSIYDKAAERELVPPGRAANLLQLHRDTPTYWDAWDIDRHYRRHARRPRRGHRTTARGSCGSFGASTITQTVTLRAGAPIEIDTHVDWHERQKLLKLAFPLDVHADRAASEIQFGHVHRPTHANTSWDAARFETCAHRWVHVGEPGYGVAVANDAHVRPRHHPRRPRPRPCGCRCCAPRSSPIRTPTRANTGSAWRCGSARRSATPSPRATGSTCRCAGCAAATTSRRSWWWTTRPWSSRR